MSERAFKYQGLGNDFVVLDRRAAARDIDAAAARRICDRRLGVGADGVLVLLPSSQAVARMVVHNADGSVAEMCGNGIRCAAKHLVDGASERPEQLRIETGAGVLSCAVRYRAGQAVEVEVSMGKPLLVAPNLPSHRTGTPFVDQPLPGAEPWRGTAVSMGNPHLVLFVPRAQLALLAQPAQVEQLGRALETHPLFPQRTNVELAVVESDGLTVRVWERGAGLTLACGTGACAALVAATVEKRLAGGKWTSVRLPGGSLQVRVADDLSQVHLKGPAERVFEADLPAELT